MKQMVGWTRIVVQLALVACCVFAVFIPGSASAATCSNSANYGAVTVQLPQLAQTGQYAVWLRVQASDATHNKVLVEINATDCLTLGGSALTTPKQWVWVPYSTDDTSAATYNFTQSSNNTAKIIGIQSDVKVDKIMITPLGCVPTGSGDGCVTQPNSQPTAGNTVKTVQPLSNVPVSGKVYPTATIAAEKASISAVSYSSDGALIQTIKGAGMFDTTLISNGKHSISIAIARKNGTVDNEVTVLEVNNPDSVLSPLVRWVKLNIRAVLLAAAIILSLLLIRLIWWAIRTNYAKRRYRQFHGL